MTRHGGRLRLAFLTGSDANIHILSPHIHFMGCNLRDLVTPEDIDLASLSGQRVGIDAFLTAFQFLTTMRDRSPQSDGGPLRSDDGKVVSHLMGFLNRTATLLSFGIKPVYIFDGESPELKAAELASRRA